jgi:hypothetical protein
MARDTPTETTPETDAPRTAARTVETTGASPDAATAEVAPASTKKRSPRVNDGPTGRYRREHPEETEAPTPE